MWTILPKQAVEPHLCLTGGPMCLFLSSDEAIVKRVPKLAFSHRLGVKNRT